MTGREDEFLLLYRRERFDEQYGWYERRIEEFERAYDQIITLTAGLLFGAAACGLAASADVAGWRTGWAVLAAALSAAATLVGAYEQLIGYEQHTKLYRDGQAALGALRAEAPWLTPASAAGVPDFVERVEAVFQNEMGQWGQLAPTTSTPGAPDVDTGGDDLG